MTERRQSDELSSKQLIRQIVALQQELELPVDEHRLAIDDLTFLATEPPSTQDDWSIDAVSSVAFPSESPTAADASSSAPPDDFTAESEHLAAWLRTHLLPQRDLDSYVFYVMDGVIRALVDLQLAKPSSDDAATWLIAFFRGAATLPRTASTTNDAAAVSSPHPPTTSRTNDSTMPLFFKTNYELLRRIETLKLTQRDMHARLERLQEAHAQLEDELAVRNRFIAALAVSHVTTRTHALMDGTPVFLNAQKHWVLPGYLLEPTDLSDAELLGLRRAEAYWMQLDEQRWKRLLIAQKRYDASVRIQSAWRCARASRAYEALTKRRKEAATVIQRNYFHYLFHRAIRLPDWCILGREVLVAPSIAYKCAITFQFYPLKDFPTGNYRRLPAERMSVREMMDVCQQDEECAGFSTDGAMKRFLPRKLSQLKPMAAPAPEDSHRENHDNNRDDGDIDDKTPDLSKTQSTHAPRGLYVKVRPSKTEAVVNTGIIVAVPDDRFGLVDVVLDGTGVLERVPLAKLSDRWKRVRIRLKHKRVAKPVKRTFVFGKATDAVSQSDDDRDDSLLSLDLQSNNASSEFETLDEQQELEVEAAARRRRRRRQQSLALAAATATTMTAEQAMPESYAAASGNTPTNADSDDDDEESLLEFLYQDQATKRVLRREPHHTFEDVAERAQVIATRQQVYQEEQTRKYEVQKLASVVRLQCAWRSKRAREAFRQVIALRAKEKAREALVQQVHTTAAASTKNQKRGAATTPKRSAKGFFAKLFRA